VNGRLATLQQTVQNKPQSPEAWAEIANIMDSANAATRDPAQLSDAYIRLVYMAHRPSMEAAKRFARTTHDVPLGVALLNAGQTSVLTWLARGLDAELADGAPHADALLDALRKHALTNHDAALMCDLVRRQPKAVHALYVMLEDYKVVSARADVAARRWPALRDAVEGLLHDWIAADHAETAALLAALSAAAPKDYVPPEVADEIVQCVLCENFDKARKLAKAYAPQLLAVAGSIAGGPLGVGAEVAAALLSVDGADGVVDSAEAHLDAAYAAVRKSNSALAAKVEAVASKMHVKLTKGGFLSCLSIGGAAEPAAAAPAPAAAQTAQTPAPAADDGAAASSTPVPAEPAAAASAQQ